MMITFMSMIYPSGVKAPPAGFVAVLCGLTKTVNNKGPQPVPLQMEEKVQPKTPATSKNNGHRPET